ncbi:restriction endonuclease [Actinosynnema sp. NPDC059335]|uniref:restriction endonuclease n=1 Tax=Actinosynnema sp. NPDC059335 TaxID=3346804 RepID=UPI003672A690
MPVVDGKNYERRVMRYLTEKDKYIEFDLDVMIADTTGQRKRQIDIWLPKTREIVECKNYSNVVGIEIVDAMVGTMVDIGATGGRIFSSAGFTKPALSRAEKASIRCEKLSAQEEIGYFPAKTGDGYYTGDYVDLCLSSKFDCDTFGRINYIDCDDNITPLCVGRSVNWNNPKMHGFIAYIILLHIIGRPPSNWVVKQFVDEYGDYFKQGSEWVLEEREASTFAIAED